MKLIGSTLAALARATSAAARARLARSNAASKTARSPTMFTLTPLDTTPPASMKSQVLQTVEDYLSDISPVSRFGHPPTLILCANGYYSAVGSAAEPQIWSYPGASCLANGC